MNNRFVGMLMASAVLLQSQAAAAACASDKVIGNWGLAGTWQQGGSSFAFYCPSLNLTLSHGTKYSATAVNCRKVTSGIPAEIASISATASIIIATNCKVTGTFKLSRAGTIHTTTIVHGRLENPTGTATSSRGQVVASVAGDEVAAYLVLSLDR
jgi:hypothetical protein